MRRFPYHPALRLAALAAFIVATTPALAAGPPRGDEVVLNGTGPWGISYVEKKKGRETKR
jgi:hypothetical protein